MVDVEIEMQCEKCGNGLNATVGFRTIGAGGVYCEVEPCGTCIEKAKEDGFQEGRDRANE